LSGTTGFVVADSVFATYGQGGAVSTVALNDVSFTLDRAAVVALRGASGTGKSTLLRVLGGLQRPDRGSVFVDGVSVWTKTDSELRSFRRKLGFVFQAFDLVETLSAEENVVLPVLPFKTSFDRYSRARTLLAAVGLADRCRALPRELSGGEQQRVAIARALINQPELVLADEPTANLDSSTSASIMALLLEVRDRFETAIIVATHDQEVAAKCDMIITLRDGAIYDKRPSVQASVE
jgi:putative ABC transport system ATP-binding protein